MSFIDSSQAAPPLVVALDVGTSSARAILFDARARQVTGMEAIVSCSLESTPDGGVELIADDLFNASVRCLDDLYRKADSLAQKVQAIATCTFWHSLVGVDGAGKAVTPVYLWADVRSRQAAARLRERLDEEEYHRRTGCMFHHSYLPAKLIWLEETQTPLFARAARWMSFGEYLHARLLVASFSSISMASASGLFDQHTQDWDDPILRNLPIHRSQLPALGDLDRELPGLQPSYLNRWPRWKQARWIPAVGDGATSNIGSGCVTGQRLALMIGTSGALRVCWEPDSFQIRRGLWCYRADRRRILMGGALSNGGILFSWLRETFQLPSPDQLDRLIAKVEPDSHGLTILPFLVGERSPEWADHARGAIVGLTLQTTPVQVIRACLEAVAYRFTMIHELLLEVVARDVEIVATGGALQASEVWKQILADALGRPILSSEEPEASSRGATLLALRALGVISKLEELPAGTGKVYQPDSKRHEIYRGAIERQKHLFRLLVS